MVIKYIFYIFLCLNFRIFTLGPRIKQAPPSQCSGAPTYITYFNVVDGSTTTKVNKPRKPYFATHQLLPQLHQLDLAKITSKVSCVTLLASPTPSHGLNTATRVHTRVLIVTQPQIRVSSLLATVSSLLNTVTTISQPILNIYT